MRSISQKPRPYIEDFPTFTDAPPKSLDRLGLISYHEFYQPNLLLQSNNFGSTSWTKIRCSAVESASVYVPGTTRKAWKLVEDNTAGNNHFVNQVATYTAGPSTARIVAKADERNWMYFRCQDPGSTFAAYFNLATGAVATKIGAVTATAIPLSDGWYDCRLTWTATAGAGTVGIYLEEADNYGTFDGTGTSPYTEDDPGIYIADAQLYRGTYIPPYQQTTDLQSIDNLFQKRRNLLWCSEEFSNAKWTKTRSSVSGDCVANPLNGLIDADKLIEDGTASNTHELSQSIVGQVGATYTFSVFAKAGGRDHINLMLMKSGYTQIAGYTFHLDNGSLHSTNIAGAGYGITPFGGGWYRLNVRAVNDGTGVVYTYIQTHNSTSGSYTGDGTSGIYIYGAQLEQSSYPSPYQSTQTSLQRGSSINSDTADPSFDGYGAVCSGDDYFLSGNLNEIDMSGEWTVILCGLFNGSTTAKFPWGISVAGNDTNYSGFKYTGVSNQLAPRIVDQTSGVDGNIVVTSTTDNICMALSCLGGVLTLKRMDTGACGSTISKIPTGTPRLGIGIAPRLTLNTIVDSMTCYSHFFCNRALSDSEIQIVYKYMKTSLAKKGITVL
jgi:hypothetical protein